MFIGINWLKEIRNLNVEEFGNILLLNFDFLIWVIKVIIVNI